MLSEVRMKLTRQFAHQHAAEGAMAAPGEVMSSLSSARDERANLLGMMWMAFVH